MIRSFLGSGETLEQVITEQANGALGGFQSSDNYDIDGNGIWRASKIADKMMNQSESLIASVMPNAGPILSKLFGTEIKYCN